MKTETVYRPQKHRLRLQGDRRHGARDQGHIGANMRQVLRDQHAAGRDAIAAAPRRAYHQKVQEGAIGEQQEAAGGQLATTGQRERAHHTRRNEFVSNTR